MVDRFLRAHALLPRGLIHKQEVDRVVHDKADGHGGDYRTGKTNCAEEQPPHAEPDKRRQHIEEDAQHAIARTSQREAHDKGDDHDRNNRASDHGAYVDARQIGEQHVEADAFGVHFRRGVFIQPFLRGRIESADLA